MVHVTHGYQRRSPRGGGKSGFTSGNHATNILRMPCQASTHRNNSLFFMRSSRPAPPTLQCCKSDGCRFGNQFRVAGRLLIHRAKPRAGPRATFGNRRNVVAITRRPEGDSDQRGWRTRTTSDRCAAGYTRGSIESGITPRTTQGQQSAYSSLSPSSRDPTEWLGPSHPTCTAPYTWMKAQH